MGGFYDSLLRLHSNSGLSQIRVQPIQIDGSLLPNGTATNAALSIGSRFCVARDDGSNLVTIIFNESLRNAPMVFPMVNATDTVVDAVTSSTTGITYTTVQNDDTTTGVNDADVNLLLVWFDSVDVL